MDSKSAMSLAFKCRTDHVPCLILIPIPSRRGVGGVQHIRNAVAALPYLLFESGPVSTRWQLRVLQLHLGANVQVPGQRLVTKSR